MKRRSFWLGALLVAVVATLAAAQSQVANDLVVHEWGTFLAMHGSDGVALDGMYHEEHALPAFVHARSRDQLRLPSAVIKGETPVIYFYTDRTQKVRVTVRFPRGIWTQWYPQASRAGPSYSQMGSPLRLRDGRLIWCAEVIPAAQRESPALPKTSSDALWNFARDVDAAFVRNDDWTSGKARSEYERFLFYRGLGDATTPLRMTAEQNGTLTWEPGSAPGGRHLFILRVEGGRGAWKHLPALEPGERVTDAIPSMADAVPLSDFSRKVGDDLEARLVECGLFPKEARAMVNTWRASYFQSPGVRVLFVLPQEWTDGFIPMEIHPRPKQVVRVMVGRLELLTPSREQLAERTVRDLASPDAPARERAFAQLRDQGRYVEPILRRVLRTTTDEKVRMTCRRLLLTDFVTELRSAIHAPADGKRLAEQPLHARAQLASLLREIGLDDEAKAEALPVHAAISQQKAPPMSDSEARVYLRTTARALEGLGRDAEAAAAYARLIRFGAQIKQSRQCLGCHDGTAAPREMTWFRDWWAGHRYAQSVARISPLDAAIARQEAALKQAPDDISGRMMLAYLYQERQEPAKAAEIWAHVEPSPQLVRR